MAKFILFVVVICAAYLFFCGIRRALRAISGREGGCGCGEDHCTCGSTDSDKLPNKHKSCCDKKQ